MYKYYFGTLRRPSQSFWPAEVVESHFIISIKAVVDLAVKMALFLSSSPKDIRVDQQDDDAPVPHSGFHDSFPNMGFRSIWLSTAKWRI